MKRLLLLLICIASSQYFLIAQSAGGEFTVGPDMQSSRIAVAIGQADDGSYILFGGRSAGFVSSQYADVYDPELQTFTNVNMLYPHDNAVVVKTADGKFFIAGGGYSYGIPAYANAEWYDPATRTFSDGGYLLYPRMQASGTQLSNGKILIVGAWYDPAAAQNTELYDPDEMVSVAGAALNIPRSSALVFPCNDGGAIVVGGYPTYGGICFSGAEYYDAGANMFIELYDELIPSEPGFTTAMDNANKAISQMYAMEDGKYIFLAWRTDPVVEYALITFDPETKLFAKIDLDQSLMGTYSDGGMMQMALNKDANLAYLLATDVDAGPSAVALVTVDLMTGKVYQPEMAFVMPANAYLTYGNMVFIPEEQKLLYAGVSASAVDYFNATTGTYYIEPEFTVDVPEAEYAVQCSVFPNPSRGIVDIYMEVPDPTSFTFLIADAAGRKMCEEVRHAAVVGNFHWRLDMQNFPTGTYNLLIQSDAMQITKRIVIID